MTESPHRDLVVIGASAGGVEALMRVMAGLPRSLPAAVCVVLHIPPHAASVLGQILGRAGPLPVSTVREEVTIRPGHVYVAPPDHHLIVHDGTLRLSRGPRENGHRPAVDPLFRTAARAYGRRVIGVVLTGSLDDGTAGLIAIRARGGLCVAQSPDDALYPAMPKSAIENAYVDHVVTLDGLPALLTELVEDRIVEVAPSSGSQRPSPSTLSPLIEKESAMAEMDPKELGVGLGAPSPYVCPDCHGVLWQVHDDNMLRFRCLVGHAYSPEALSQHQASALDEAMWTAYRALKESAHLRRQLAQHAGPRSTRAAAEYGQQAQDAEEKAEIVRQVLMRDVRGDPGGLSEEPPPLPGSTPLSSSPRGR